MMATSVYEMANITDPALSYVDSEGKIRYDCRLRGPCTSCKVDSDTDPPSSRLSSESSVGAFIYTDLCRFIQSGELEPPPPTWQLVAEKKDTYYIPVFHP